MTFACSFVIEPSRDRQDTITIALLQIQSYKYKNVDAVSNGETLPGWL